MKDREVRHALVTGSRFRATPVYSESRQLDELARFFYEEVLTRETDLGRLRRIFGLPQRVVDEVLADLVRLNFATLDVASSRILRNPNSAPHPDFFPTREEEFWQDALTGAVIRYRDIPPVYRRAGQATGKPDSIELVAPDLDAARDFRNLPGARLVSILKATSPKMAVLVGGAQLERLDGRVSLGQEALRIPILHAQVDRNDVAFVSAPELTPLLTRAWSRELNRQLGARAEPSLQLALACEGDLSQIDSPYLLESTSLSGAIHSYLQAVWEVGKPRGFSWPDPILEAYESRRDSLLERIESVVAMAMSGPNADATSHFAGLWARARRYLLVVVEDATEGAIRALVESLGPPTTWRATLIVVEGSGGSPSLTAALPREVSPDLLRTVHSREPLPSGLCIRDGVELRFGSLSEIVGDRPLPRIAGGKMPRDVAIQILPSLPLDGASSFLQTLVAGAENREARLAARLTGRSEVDGACDALSRTVRDCDALVRSTLDLARPKWKQRFTDPLYADLEEDPEGVSPSVPTLRELEPRIVPLESELANRAAVQALPEPLATCHQPQATSPVAVLAEVIRTVLGSKRIRSLLIAFDTGADALETPEIRGLLEKALAHECEIRLHLNPITGSDREWDAASVAALRHLEQTVVHHRLFVYRGATRVPVSIVVDSSLVVLGQRTWFTEGSGHEIFLAFEAPHVASALRTAATSQ